MGDLHDFLLEVHSQLFLQLENRRVDWGQSSWDSHYFIYFGSETPKTRNGIPGRFTEQNLLIQRSGGCNEISFQEFLSHRGVICAAGRVLVP